ncbi:DUF6516 family protein [Rhizobium puerariae]|uniref:DUF6516 family protein n=1 Tax=Rhizobium puerariae TaxID=1585791 RepID=A0ABV6AJZ0_9HYPH
MKAELVIRERIVFRDGAIMEIKIWRVPEKVPPSQHFLKYSLFYGRPGERSVGYDNERDKGDHRHYGSHRFISIEQMLVDFRQDVEAIRGEKI